MRKKQIENYRKLKEDDIPITRGDDNKTLTPNRIYEWNKRMKPKFTLSPDWDLLEERLETKLEKGMLMTVHTLDGELTPEKQLEEVRNKTAVGYKFMLAEKGLLDYLLSYE